MRDDGAQAVRVPAVTLDDLLAEAGEVALVKVDIEGAELDALLSVAADRLDRVDQLAVEFHDMADPQQAPRVEEVKRRLRGLGFLVLPFSRDNADVLFVNRARMDVGPAQRTWIAARYKYPNGLARMARRRLGAS
jgi:hypothetical protein